MIESYKYNRENYPRKCFWTQERETRVKFNPGLSTNRPSNNWAQVSGKNCNRFELPHSVWTNPVYKTSWASLPAKQYYSWFQFRFNVQLLHDWSNFDLPKLTPVEHISLMPSSCLSARIQANKLLITAQPIRNLRTLVSTEMNKRGFL